MPEDLTSRPEESVENEEEIDRQAKYRNLNDASSALLALLMNNKFDLPGKLDEDSYKKLNEALELIQRIQYQEFPEGIMPPPIPPKAG
jgi:hypothetical protein